MTPIELGTRIATALVLGVIIGFERQWHRRPAGLRTNALVAVGSAGFVLISALMNGENSPTRIAAQVASGIGFLGAGVILREGLSVRGLNTAATLWCSAAVGSLAGLGLTGGGDLDHRRGHPDQSCLASARAGPGSKGGEQLRARSRVSDRRRVSRRR